MLYSGTFRYSFRWKVKLQRHHVKEKIAKANKGIGMIKELNNTLSRDAWLSIYKSFVRPHLDYGDIIYMTNHKMSSSAIN